MSFESYLKIYIKQTNTHTGTEIADSTTSFNQPAYSLLYVVWRAKRASSHCHILYDPGCFGNMHPRMCRIHGAAFSLCRVFAILLLVPGQSVSDDLFTCLWTSQFARLLVQTLRSASSSRVSSAALWGEWANIVCQKALLGVCFLSGFLGKSPFLLFV